MNDPQFDVTAIGNAIVDVLAQADDAFLSRYQLAKGAMSLIDAEIAERLYGHMGPGIEISGGSAANTAAAIAGLGGRAAFIGKVADDQLGAVFAHDIRAAGVTFDTPPLAGDGATARCLIFVTPDAQRTMQTFLGVSSLLSPEDVDPARIRASRVIYLEGYLWDQPRAKEAFLEAARIARAASREVSLTLSDSFCVDRHRADFLALIEDHVDVLFANEDEIKSLYEVDDFDAALERVRRQCRVVALTRSARGSVVVSGDALDAVPAANVEHVIDTTGAGDAYAAGFLDAYTRDRPLANCARLGGIVAAEVISHYGARAEADLRHLATAAGMK